MAYNNTQFWAFVRKAVLDYWKWVEDVRQENDRLIASGKYGINAMFEYNDTDSQDIVTTMRAAVKFGQCTGEEYREALRLIRIADQEFRYELMKMELMAAGEIKVI